MDLGRARPSTAGSAGSDHIHLAGSPDNASRDLLRTLRAVAVTAGLVGLLSFAVAGSFGEPRMAAFGLIAMLYAIWLFDDTRRSATDFGERAVLRMTIATMLAIGAGAILVPSIGTALAVTTFIPVVLALPFASKRSMAVLMVTSGVIATAAWMAGTWLPRSDRLPDAAQAGLAMIVVACSIPFLLVFLWLVSRRLKDTAADLRSVVTMSSDLARSLDPQLVGDGIARHIASALGSDDCALSYWDRDGDRVVTLGFHPPERRSTLDDTYALDAYPATRRILLDQTALVVDVGDPRADRSEVEYLESLGQRSMLMMPLIAAGTTVGLIELTSGRSDTFDVRRIELAAMLAREAAMGLENARLYDKIHHQAFHDGLTGLANRVMFRDHVETALGARSSTGRVAVLFLDMDDFKDVNDRFGHEYGDQVLAEVGRRIQGCLRPGDLAARLGGDEFAVLLADVPDTDIALGVAGRILDVLRRPFDVGSTSTDLGASIGVAIDGPEADAVEELLRNADVAMYAAKVTSRGRTEIFRPELRDAVVARAERSNRLRGAESRGELRVEYQPIVELETRRILGMEALVRWQVPGEPLAMPADFIGLAEETGEIMSIGRWVLREACRQTRDWQRRLGLDELEISVNLSARQFQDVRLAATVRDALADSGLAPGDLVLELTESALMLDTESTMTRLQELRALGVRLAIDDFGTGYSSLSYLQRFAVDILKIDRSFVVGLGARHDEPVLASAIVELGRALGLVVIAEGIERQDQLDAVRQMGCRQGQGYLFGRAQEPAAAEVILASSKAASSTARRATTRRRVDSIEPPLRLISGD